MVCEHRIKVKNGFVTQSGKVKQRYLCKECGRMVLGETIKILYK